MLSTSQKGRDLDSITVPEIDLEAMKLNPFPSDVSSGTYSVKYQNRNGDKNHIDSMDMVLNIKQNIEDSIL